MKSFKNIKPEIRKKGFSIPLTKWIKTDYKNVFYEKLLDKTFCQTFDIETKKMEELLTSHINGGYDYKWSLFSLYGLSVWNDARD